MKLSRRQLLALAELLKAERALVDGKWKDLRTAAICLAALADKEAKDR